MPVDRHDAPDRPAPGVADADAVRPRNGAPPGRPLVPARGDHPGQAATPARGDHPGQGAVPAGTAPAPRVVLGVGASRGCPPDELDALVDAALAEAGLPRAAVVAVASADVKADEPAVLALAAGLGVPARFFPASALAVVDVPTPSVVVASHVGTPSVAEAAALLVAAEPPPRGPDGHLGTAVPRNATGDPVLDTTLRQDATGDPARDTTARQDATGDPARDTTPRLVVPKRRSPHATCAVALVGTATVAPARPPAPTEVPLP